MDIAEGTIYPLLNRLKKDALVEARWVEQPSGVPRKYYRITREGEQILSQMEDTWEQLTSSIARMRLTQ